MKSNDLWVYVAGPYTKPDPCVNTRNAVLVGLRLREMGFVPIIPHLSHLMHLIEPHNYEFWTQWDFDWLGRCDALLVLQGESPGARAEEDLAERFGIPVIQIGTADYLDYAELVDWAMKLGAKFPPEEE
jgi:hypothetical protein